MSATVPAVVDPQLAAEVPSRRTFARETVETAVPGDIVGIVNATSLQVGDTLYSGGHVAFPPIPTFAPERFATVRNRDAGRYKQFRAGLVQLDEEGVVHVLRRPDLGDQEPIFAGVGQLQFDVAAYRMEHEFGCPITLAPAPWQLARQIDPAHAGDLAGQRQTMLVDDRHGRTLVLFASPHALQWAEEDHPRITFAELGLARQQPPAWSR